MIKAPRPPGPERFGPSLGGTTQMKLRRALAATTLLASGGAIALAAPANADLVTRCVGEGGAVTVPGDLVVPAGKTCWLDGTTVEGNVRVQAGADLIVTGGTLKGSVVVDEIGRASGRYGVVGVVGRARSKRATNRKHVSER